jgi:hypothetical protein
VPINGQMLDSAQGLFIQSKRDIACHERLPIVGRSHIMSAAHKPRKVAVPGVRLHGMERHRVPRSPRDDGMKGGRSPSHGAVCCTVPPGCCARRVLPLLSARSCPGIAHKTSASGCVESGHPRSRGCPPNLWIRLWVSL